MKNRQSQLFAVTAMQLLFLCGSALADSAGTPGGEPPQGRPPMPPPEALAACSNYPQAPRAALTGAKARR